MINIKYLEEYSEDVEVDHIIKQQPSFQENYNINVGEEIILTVSKGQKIITLPKKMVGKKVEDVKIELDNIEAIYEVIEETSEEIEKGIIISTDPEAGEEINASNPVKITVSSGSQYKDFVMPNVLNSSEEEAKAALAGLQNLRVTYNEDENKSDGIVTSQSVVAGKTIKENEEVTIVVNKQPKKATVTVNVNLKSLMNYVEPAENAVNPPASSGKLEVLVGDDTIYSATKSFNETNISASYTGTGVKTVKVKVDGVIKSSNQSVDFNKGDTTISIP